VVAGVNRAKAAGAATVVEASNAPTLAEAVDAVAARSLTSPSRLVHVSTIRAANVARKSHRKANVSGLACGPVAANATLPSLNSRRSNPNRCAIALTAIMDVVERKVQVHPRETLLKSVVDAVAAMAMATVMDMDSAVMDLTVDSAVMDHSVTDLLVDTEDISMVDLFHFTK